MTFIISNILRVSMQNEFPRICQQMMAQSSAFKNLDKAVSAALGKCKFKRALKDGKPEQAWMKIDYAWKLD